MTFSLLFQVLCRWLLTVRKNYRNVIYHNWRHAFNVAQSMFCMLVVCRPACYIWYRNAYKAVFKWMNFAFSLNLLNYALWLVRKTRATFSTNEKQTQSRLDRTHDIVPWVLIGSLCYLRVLWLVRLNTSLLILQHSVENRSNYIILCYC